MRSFYPAKSSMVTTTTTSGQGAAFASSADTSTILRNVTVANVTKSDITDYVMEFRDGGASGVVRFKFMPTNQRGGGFGVSTGTIADTIEFPGRGIRFDSYIYLKWTFTSTSNNGLYKVTVIYT